MVHGDGIETRARRDEECLVVLPTEAHIGWCLTNRDDAHFLAITGVNMNASSRGKAVRNNKLPNYSTCG